MFSQFHDNLTGEIELYLGSIMVIVRFSYCLVFSNQNSDPSRLVTFLHNYNAIFDWMARLFFRSWITFGFDEAL